MISRKRHDKILSIKKKRKEMNIYKGVAALFAWESIFKVKSMFT